MTEENKALARRLEEEVWGRGNLDIIDELLAPDFIAHVAGAPAPIVGPNGVKSWAMQWQAAFPDARATVEDQIAEGDKVVSRITLTGTHLGHLMGIPPTGRHGTITAIAINRFSNGKVIEIWSIFDLAGLLAQLGAPPSANAIHPSG